MSNPYEDPFCFAKEEKKILKALIKKSLRKRRRRLFKFGYCLYCGSRSQITKDHIQPKSRGGSSKLHNLQPLCAYCNSKKGNKTEAELRHIFADILNNGVWYEWEKPFKAWLDWLLIVCEERKHGCPLLPTEYRFTSPKKGI